MIETKVNKKSSFSGVPRQSWTALIFLWLVFAVNANLREIMNRITPSLVKTYSIEADSLGIIIGLILMACGSLSMPGARWADAGGHGWARKYRNLIIVLGYTVFSFLTGLNFLTVGIGGFLFLQMAKNAFSGIGEAVEVGTVAEWWPKQYLGFALGAHHTAYPWGSFIGGLVVAAILATFGEDNWRYCFLIIPLAMIPIYLGYWAWAKPKRYEEFISNTKRAGLTPPLEGEISDVKAKPGIIGRSLKNPNILWPTVCAFCCLMGYVGISFWLTPYLSFVAKYSAAAAAGLGVVFTITGGLGQIIWGLLSDKIGRKTTLIICCIWIGVAFLMMKYVGISLAYLIGIQLFAGMATNAVYPVIYSMVTESVEEGGIGTALGINLFGLYLGGGLAPMILGYLINAGGGWSSAGGYNLAMYVLAGAMFFGALVMLLFTRETCGPFHKRDFSLVSLKSCNIDE